MKKIYVAILFALIFSSVFADNVWIFKNTDFNGIEDELGNTDPCFTDIDGDGLLDLIIGYYYNPLGHFEQTAPGSSEFEQVPVNERIYLHPSEINGYDYDWNEHPDYQASPVFEDIDHDGLLDLLIGTYDTKILHFEQKAVNSREFILRTRFFNDIRLTRSIPEFTDIDGDGLLDLLVGAQNQKIHHYEQTHRDSARFILRSNNFSNIQGADLDPVCEDIDGDGLLDLLAGDSDGTIHHYEQATPADTLFNLVTENFWGIDVGRYSKPTLADFNNDGLFDLVTGGGKNNQYDILYHYSQEENNNQFFEYFTEDIPNDWTIINADNDNRFFKGTGYVNEVSNLFAYGYRLQNDYLITPRLKVTDDFDKFTFCVAVRSSSHPLNFKVMISETGKEINDFNLIPGQNYPDYNISKWRSSMHTVNLEDYTGKNIYIAFHAENADGSFGIDNISGLKRGDEQELPVEFSTFSLTQSGDDVNVKWITQTESDLRGFYVLRSETEDLASANKISDLISASNTVSAQEYVYEDKNTEVNKRYWYWIEANGFNEVSSFTTSQSILLDEENQPEEEVPEVELFTGIKYVYPNPFNPPVNISFFIDEKTAKENANAEIEIYNARGQKVHARNLGIQTEGMHTISWNGNDEEGKECGSGIYFVKFTAGSHRSFEKSIKLK